MDYVNKRRLIKSSEAILNGGKIIDAALQFGWQTHSGFTKSFKNEFGFYPALLKGIKMQITDLGGSAMEHIFLKSTDIHATKETLFQNLKDRLRMEASLEAIYAGLFCDVLQKTSVNVEWLRGNLPDKTVKYIEKAYAAGKNLDKYLDDEVVLIKLAERLHNMRTLEFMEDSKRHIKAKETLEEILPIAQKTGMQKLVDELNDLALKYL